MEKIPSKIIMTWVIVPLEHLNPMEQEFLQYVRKNGDPSRDYPYNPEDEIKLMNENKGIVFERSSRNGEQDKYGYTSTLLVTHETGSWEAWKMKSMSEIFMKMSKK